MTDETNDPDLTADELLMLDLGWLDLWHVDRQDLLMDEEAG